MHNHPIEYTNSDGSCLGLYTIDHDIAMQFMSLQTFVLVAWSRKIQDIQRIVKMPSGESQYPE